MGKPLRIQKTLQWKSGQEEQKICISFQHSVTLKASTNDFKNDGFPANPEVAPRPCKHLRVGREHRFYVFSLLTNHAPTTFSLNFQVFITSHLPYFQPPVPLYCASEFFSGSSHVQRFAELLARQLQRSEHPIPAIF